MIDINITKFIEQKRAEESQCFKADIKIVRWYKARLIKLENISRRLNNQYERKKNDYFFQTEVFKLNDSVANVLKNIIKFGLSNEAEIDEIMKSQQPVRIRVC